MPRRFYITTAIDYVNGKPHMGHAYEKVLADALARFHRQRGDATYFLTGTDEHGQKVARNAEAAGKSPKTFVDELVPSFVAAWKTLGVAYDQFIRTTDPRHELAVQELFARLAEARSPKTGDPALFEEEYEGLYCEGCEEFKQEKDLVDGLCPIHHTKPKHVKESNFFFRLSEYNEALLKHIQAHPDFIWPEYRRNEVMNVIKDGLRDVSVTRLNVPWGISLPEEIPGASSHTAYVWADALLNYLSALGWPERRYSLWWLAKESDVGGPGATRQDVFADLDGQGRPGAAWAGTATPQYTNAFHLIGKDISRFHCILWPALLLAAGVPLPRQVYVHGFILTRGGEKLSKSSGVVVDPVEIAGRFGADALRFYLLDAVPTGRDGEFTLELFVEHCNTHLANDLGNLASRTATMVHKYFDGVAPADWTPETLETEARAKLDEMIAATAAAHQGVPERFESIEVHEALALAWQPVVRANEFIEKVKPWVLAKDPARRAELGTALAALLETLRLVAVWAWPAIPGKSDELWDLLALPGRPGETRGAAAAPRYGQPSQARGKLGEVKSLFPRIELRDEATAGGA
ncbi:MAG: class I tRNA ligase family protein [Candidatus Eisenbacteria bacterium]